MQAYWLRYRILFSFRIFIDRWKLWKKCPFFGVDMSSSMHGNKKGKDILILGEGPT